jgi:hypothetical protein
MCCQSSRPTGSPGLCSEKSDEQWFFLTAFKVASRLLPNDGSYSKVTDLYLAFTKWNKLNRTIFKLGRSCKNY